MEEIPTTEFKDAELRPQILAKVWPGASKLWLSTEFGQLAQDQSPEWKLRLLKRFVDVAGDVVLAGTDYRNADGSTDEAVWNDEVIAFESELIGKVFRMLAEADLNAEN